jgi:hypothetical protein
MAELDLVIMKVLTLKRPREPRDLSQDSLCGGQDIN